MYPREIHRSRGVRAAEEVQPLPCSAPIPIVYGRGPSSPRKPRRLQPPSASLARKYVTYQVDNNAPLAVRPSTVYGTLPTTSKAGKASPRRGPEEEEPLLLTASSSSTDCSSNQSETESDSDGSSTGSSGSGAALQSILRLGGYSCRRVRKQASVEFAIDIDDDDDDLEATLPRYKRRGCASRCVPRCVHSTADLYW